MPGAPVVQAGPSRSQVCHRHDEAIDGRGVHPLALRGRAQQRALVGVEEVGGGAWLGLGLGFGLGIGLGLGLGLGLG